MEQINTYNYQAWFIDYIDGQLNPAQVKELVEFLSQHPDLADELNEFENVELDVPALDFNRKLDLKKGEILDSYIDEQCVAYIENDLNNKDKKQLTHLVRENPSTWRTFELYKKTKLVADNELVFEKKSQLKHIEFDVYRRRILSYAAVAASVALIVGLFFTLNKKQEIAPLAQVSHNTEQPIETKVEEPIQSGKPPKSKKRTEQPVLVKAQKLEYKQLSVRREYLHIERIDKIDIDDIVANNTAAIIAKPNINITEMPEISQLVVQSENTITTKDKQQSESLLWLLAAKSVDMLNKFNITNVTIRKEKNELNNTTTYAFDTKWVSVYAHVNDKEQN